MALIAITSDIHGNLPALLRALHEIHYVRGIPYSNIRDLGDNVGYGPFPNECTEILKLLGIPSLMGNHDKAGANDSFDTRDWNGAAETAIKYARNELTQQNKDYLDAKPYTFGENPELDAQLGFECAHSSLLRPEDFCYIEEGPDGYRVSAVDTYAAMNAPVLFVGHSHVPGIMKQNTKVLEGYELIDTSEGVRELDPNVRHIVNVCSVGQPRARNRKIIDPRTCFVIYNTDVTPATVEYVRLHYSLEKIMQATREAYTIKIKEVNKELASEGRNQLPEKFAGKLVETVGDLLAERLAVGR
ncbi:metallophosphatase family protein [Candidatus Woesearchaeota archaeon]|nr:metallophosphatase family protein [Candidatus Woesearchaeota archaeon]